MANLMLETSLHPSPLPSRGGHAKTTEAARREDGQSLIELALVLPLFLVILLGSAEVGRFAWASVLTSNAARAGAAYAAVNPMNSVNITGIQAAVAADGVNITGLTATPAPSISCTCSSGATISQCVSTASTPSTSLSDCPAPATITNFVTVNTTSTVTVFGHSFTATGHSTMVVAP